MIADHKGEEFHGVVFEVFVQAVDGVVVGVHAHIFGEVHIVAGGESAGIVDHCALLKLRFFTQIQHAGCHRMRGVYAHLFCHVNAPAVEFCFHNTLTNQPQARQEEQRRIAGKQIEQVVEGAEQNVRFVTGLKFGCFLVLFDFSKELLRAPSFPVSFTLKKLALARHYAEEGHPKNRLHLYVGSRALTPTGTIHFNAPEKQMGHGRKCNNWQE